jgi:hypothetical protein
VGTEGTTVTIITTIIEPACDGAIVVRANFDAVKGYFA